MKKQSNYAAPDILVEQFVCEKGFKESINPVTFSDAYGFDEEFDETQPVY